MKAVDEHCLELAAIAWWRTRRPVKWTLRKHLKYPAVNTRDDAELQLALAVAAVVAKARAKRG